MNICENTVYAAVHCVGLFDEDSREFSHHWRSGNAPSTFS